MKSDPTLRVTLMPKDTNRHGMIFGGIIMSHIDLAGAIKACRAAIYSFWPCRNRTA